MKHLFTPTKIVVFILLSVALSMAGNTTIVDDILLIPYTDDAPTIDGQLDGVWNSVTAIPMLYHENHPVENVWDTVGVYADHHTMYRAMWDEDYFYVFVQVVDEELDGSEKASPWMSDCIEIFFDGENEKASSYDANDIQWRWVYGEVPGDTSNGSNDVGDWAFLDTDLGYNFELRISADTLSTTYFPLEDDHEIGFEISNADRDEGVGQQDVVHWWTYVGTTWNDASLFGTALLVEDPPISSVLNIPYTKDAPTIDGTFEEGEGWEVATEISLTKAENNVPLDSILDGWTDHMSSAYTMWDEDYFYLFVKVIDQERDGSEKASPWMSDCIELFFDGDNAKSSSYDANDIQWRWVYGEVPGDTSNGSNDVGEWAFKDTDIGYNLELRIGADTLATYFPLENDHEIGFEISNADRDDGEGQQDVLHW